MPQATLSLLGSSPGIIRLYIATPPLATAAPVETLSAVTLLLLVAMGTANATVVRKAAVVEMARSATIVTRRATPAAVAVSAAGVSVVVLMAVTLASAVGSAVMT